MQTSFTVVISFVFSSWIIYDLEKFIIIVIIEYNLLYIKDEMILNTPVLEIISW